MPYYGKAAVTLLLEGTAVDVGCGTVYLYSIVCIIKCYFKEKKVHNKLKSHLVQCNRDISICNCRWSFHRVKIITFYVCRIHTSITFL